MSQPDENKAQLLPTWGVFHKDKVQLKSDLLYDWPFMSPNTGATLTIRAIWISTLHDLAWLTIA